MPAKPNHSQKDAQLRHLAEKRLQEEGTAQPQGDQRRILHELQVHQIQLEMQNEELRETRSRLEVLVERYTDLKDEIAQTLVAINVQLAILAQGADLNPVQKALNGKKIKRLGLIGMRERVDMVGGKFAITSSPGKGTTVRVNVPNAQKIQPPT